MRVYGNQYRTDGKGKVILIELKFGDARLDVAQERTFGLINSILRQGDPNEHRYRGYYLVQYTHEDWDQAAFSVNGVPLSRQDFIAFLQLDDQILDRINSLGQNPLT